MQPSNARTGKITDLLPKAPKATAPPIPKSNQGSSDNDSSTNQDESAPRVPPKPPATSQGHGQTTRAATGTNADSSRISDAGQAKQLLQANCMIPTSGEITMEHIVKALFDTAALSGVSKQAHGFIEAIAWILKEREYTLVRQSIVETIDNQMRLLTQNLADSQKNTLDTIGDQARKTSETSLVAIQEIKSAIASVEEKAKTIETIVTTISTQPSPTPPAPTYANILARTMPVPFSDPRVQAREGIRHRQIRIEIKNPESPLFNFNDSSLIEVMNQALDCNGKIFCIVRNHKAKFMIVETSTDEAASWLRIGENFTSFLSKINLEGNYCPRNYTVMANFVPTTFDPEKESDLSEFAEANNLPREKIVRMRWIKPMSRRHDRQTSAHLLVTVRNADTANQLILHGARFCHYHANIVKSKRDPLRCLKCHKYAGHVAQDCLELNDVCGTCGGAHRTLKCDEKSKKWCVSCQTDSHTSWDRECQTFARKAEEFDARNPDNALPYFPSNEPWTWMDLPAPAARRQDAHASSHSTNSNPKRPSVPTNQQKAFQSLLSFPSQPQPRPSHAPQTQLTETQDPAASSSLSTATPPSIPAFPPINPSAPTPSLPQSSSPPSSQLSYINPETHDGTHPTPLNV